MKVESKEGNKTTIQNLMGKLRGFKFSSSLGLAFFFFLSQEVTAYGGRNCTIE